MKSLPTYAVLLMTVVAGVMAAACDRPQSEDAIKSDKKSDPPAVTQTAALATAEAASKLDGVATILSSDTLLQIDADLRAATIAAGFSTATADRYKATGSLSRQIIENAERQAGTDITQQKLLESRLKQTWGENAPFLDAGKRQALIAKLSSGAEALVRIDFPEQPAGQPRAVSIGALSGGATAPVKTLWSAPSGNQSMPGVSYFGLIDAGPGLRPGDRARAMADGAQSRAGVIIPNGAIVIFAAQSWCYIETAPEKFERRIVSLDHPVDDGYLVTTGFTAGERVVVRGASLLLSREAGPGEDDDDDDAPKAKPHHSPAPPAAKSDDKTVSHEPGKSGAQHAVTPAAPAVKDDDDDDDAPKKGAASKPKAAGANEPARASATVAEKHGAKHSPPVDRD